MASKPRRWMIVVLAAAVVAQIGAGAAAVVVRSGDDPPTPETLLAAAQRYVLDGGSFAFAGDSRTESRLGEGGRGRGSAFVTRARLSGAIVGADRVRSSFDAGEGQSGEGIRIGSKAWIRYDDPESEVSDGPWFEFDSTEDRSGRGQSGLIVSIEPIDYLLAAVRPELVSRAGDLTVIRAGVDLSRAELSSDDAGGVASIELTVDGDRRPTHLMIGHTGLLDGNLDTSYDLAFSQWGETFVIDPPAESDIDRTPFIDEEGVLAYADARLYQPATLPEGWVLEYAEVLPADETVEGCEQVELDYTDPDDPEFGYLAIYEFGAGCADPTPPPDSVPFQAGPYRGWIIVENYGDESYVFAQVMVGATAVQADTDLSPADLATILGDLRPLDFDVEPRPVAGLGVRTVTS